MRPAATLLLLLLLVSLGLGNPGAAAFSSRVSVDLSARAARDLGLPGAASGVLGSLGQNALHEAVRARTQRRDFVFFSLYELPLSDREAIRVLGVSGQFFYLSRR